MKVRKIQVRPEPIVLSKAARYDPALYQPVDGFPVVEFVAAAGDVPAHGIVHGGEGDVVINIGDWIVAGYADGTYPTYGFVASYTWWQLEQLYEAAT